jgi:hypothetical protein
MHIQLHRMASSIVFAALVAYCVIGAATVAVDSARLLHNPWENTYTEAPQIYAAIHAAQTGRLYILMSQPPYAPQAYTPLYYAANAALARIAHSNMNLFTFYSRLSAYIAYLLCGVLVFMICRAAAISLLQSSLAALAMLGQPTFIGWNVSPRPDTLCLFAMLSSLYCAVKWHDRSWLGYALAGFFSGIAFLIKQPGLAVAIAIFVVLLAEKHFKRAAVLAASAAVPVVITLGVLCWRGDPFLEQIAFAGKSLWSFRSAAHFVIDQLFEAYWIVPFSIGALGFARAIHLDVKSKMLASFALVNWILAFFAIAQLGGYLNYFLPGLAGCALLLPYAIRIFREQVRQIVPVAIAAAALLWAASSAYAYVGGQVLYWRPPTDASLAWLAPYRILSDRPDLNLHGREPEMLDPFAAHMLELAGHWDSTPLLHGLSFGDYDLIILSRVNVFHFIPDFRGVSYFGPNEIKMMNENYGVLCASSDSMVLEPRGRDVAATPQMFSQFFNERCGTDLRRDPLDLKLAPGAQ